VGEDGQEQLAVMIAEISTKMQVLLDKQDELGENISKIKEAVYNPDEGLYARLTKLDSRLDALEGWKNLNTKVLWMVVSVSLGLVATEVWRNVF
tara:strand:+ start:1597 stop:1878 length:282 start_codon:yes stop_codon:yes gene_type:complete